MAQLGFRTFNEMVGRVDMLEMRAAVDHWKAKGLDFSSILYNPPMPARIARRCIQAQDHGLKDALDHTLIDLAREALENQTPVEIKLPIRNVHRTVGAMLSGEMARRYGSAGLPDDTIRCQFTGSAGQSFGAFLANGVTLSLEGDANDYIGKGLSGGRLIVLSAAHLDVPAGGEHPDRQRGALWRHQRRSVFQRHGGRALRGAQFRRDGGGGRRGRPRLRVHDQGPGRGAGKSGTQLRRRA